MDSLNTKRIVYSLKYLLQILTSADEISESQARIIMDHAVKNGVDTEGPDGLDDLLRFNIRRPPREAGQPESRITEDVILKAVARHEGLEFRRVDPFDLDLEVTTKTISESFARMNTLVPIMIRDGELELAVFNPFRPELWQDMERVSDLPYKVFLSTRQDIHRLIDDYYQFRTAIQAAQIEFMDSSEIGNLEARVKVAEKSDPESQRHIIKAVDYLLRSALRERASDIHIEPKRDFALVRFRIDGILHDLHRLPMTVHLAMINRLKGMSRLDISEKRRPQDGRVQLVLASVPTDVRVSTIPVAFGEKMVLRLLSSDSTIKNLEELGMRAEQHEIYSRFLSKTYGLILVTGPTGSGKSTTLYSTLKLLANPQVNVVTLEDPIEMVVDDFNQIGVQSKIGVTFGQMLRHILRQDPDIIMIGEMRDLETAEQAVQSALTGHIVFSTLHTNDASSALTRLLDLGLDAYLINAAVIGCIAQRLVRNICPHCKAQYKPDYEDIKALGLESYISPGQSLWRGRGCDHCRQTGYYGRTGIFEILPYDTEVKDAIRKNIDLGDLREMVRKKGVRSLFDDGMGRVVEGVTTIEEVLRVAGGSAD
ncbi:MAG: GspE/PulE family protein [Desulfomicrobium sp.]|nr:GspE/PulE family protein [Pseudomonadota bacterium]MBV1712767.1 GspE/PulE family protein [Desulfomicrobium sp.]MBU4571737.1 GspE/PulE family protein [Pseudomonadota bacterium]MBU4595886.1 GspE/PulE family protein [Pseudomonadota bacterium]MBV1721190.1 GspE/PulE family protein [Desulfomicrobium sp.]